MNVYSRYFNLNDCSSYPGVNVYIDVEYEESRSEHDHQIMDVPHINVCWRVSTPRKPSDVALDQ